MHKAVLDYVQANVPTGPISVLEFGSRDVNGSVRQVVPNAERYVGVDSRDGGCVDIVGDAASIDVTPADFNVVVCTEVLEHVNDETALAIIQNAHHHLTPGGLFIATMAGPGRAPHSAVEATGLLPGEFYRNVSPDELGRWLLAAGFGGYTIDVAGADVRCTAWR